MLQEWSVLRGILEGSDVGEVDRKLVLIDSYAKMLSQRRKWAGLTSRALPDGIELAVVDSTAVLSLQERRNLGVVEIGSGGGLLGIVVSILRSSWQVTMVESSSRKSAFLAEVVGALALENARVFAGRAEELDAGGTFDLCLSRASGRIVDLAPVALRLLKPGGRYIALKPSDVAGEVTEAKGAIHDAGGKPATVYLAKDLPAAYAGRVSLVVVERGRPS
jgi:16S rRNA (guanine(527)-N(7))-methyltransferase RsmG